MMKDPAFLFYSKDFYEGTRTMLPVERACYVDLMIYQHQHGIIPDDVERLSMYCSGCSVDVISRVLNDKFTKMDNQTVNQMVNGWSNQRLSKEQDNRAAARPKKIAAATLAGLISANKFSKKQVSDIKKAFKIDDIIYDNGLIIKDIELIKKRVKEMVNQMVNNLVNVNAIVNANKDEIKKEIKTKIKFAEFVEMTQKEFDSLVSAHGTVIVTKAIAKLNIYKKTSGKTYKSDAGAMQSWAIDAIKEKTQTNGSSANGNKPKPTEWAQVDSL